MMIDVCFVPMIVNDQEELSQQCILMRLEMLINEKTTDIENIR